MSPLKSSGERKAPTLHDVARAANVSVAAVSQAMNNVGALSSVTRERILLAAHELGYVPNRYAAGLRRQRSMVIGFVANTESDLQTEKRWAHYYGKQLQALVTAAGRMGYIITVIPDNRPDLLALAQVDALYLADVRPEALVVHEAKKQDIPLVSYEDQIDGTRSVTVFAGYEHATREALDALLAGGAARIGLLTEVDGYASDEVGEAVYSQWCAERGHEPRIARGDYNRGNLEGAVRSLIDSGADAFFSYYEEGPAIHRYLNRLDSGADAHVDFVALCLEDCDENSRLGVSHICVRPEQAPDFALDHLLAMVGNTSAQSTTVELPVAVHIR